MHLFDYTVNHLCVQPGGRRSGDARPSVHKRLTAMNVKFGVWCLVIANEQIESYASDFDMT